MSVETDLDRRITDAFNERARSLPSAPDLALMSPPREQPNRRPTRVLVLALVTLLVISGAGVLVAVRRSGDAKGAVQSGGSGAARYRSTVLVQVAPERGNGSAPPTGTPELRLTNPLKLALAPRLRSLALKKSGVDPAGTPVEFGASEDAKHSLITLVITAPTGALATSVARSWASAFAAAGRVSRRHLLLVQKRGVNRQLMTLNRQLATIDTDLAKLDPASYRGLFQYDEPNGLASTRSQGSTPLGPHGFNYGKQPVPEQGSVRELNLAFERIQLLAARTKAGAKGQSLRFELLTPAVIQVISQTPAARVTASK